MSKFKKQTLAYIYIGYYHSRPIKQIEQARVEDRTLLLNET